MVRQQADFFHQFAVHGRFRAFARLDAALRELPRMLAHPLAPEDTVLAVDENDTDIRAIAFPVQHDSALVQISNRAIFPYYRPSEKQAAAYR